MGFLLTPAITKERTMEDILYIIALWFLYNRSLVSSQHNFGTLFAITGTFLWDSSNNTKKSIC